MAECCKKMQMNQIEEGEDRLSSLPDSILVSILNSLPIDSAAATSVLSHRWRHLWTQRDSIYFPPVGKLDKYKTYEHFITTVDHIISKLTTLKINELTLDISCVDDPKSFTFMLPFFSNICSLNPKGISLRLRDVGVAYYFQLPSSLFQIQSLSSLKLSGVHMFESMLPHEGINLPNLKELHLYLLVSHLNFLGTLSKGCPLLEHLVVLFRQRVKGHFIGEIIAPNLKVLTICCRGTDLKFVITTSKLEKIRFVGHLPFIHFIHSPILLQKSSFDLVLVQDNDVDYPSKVQRLFQQISCVGSLDFGQSDPHLLSTLNGIAIPTFRNITHLSLDSINIDGSSRVPLGLLCKLKKVELSEVVGNGLEMKFVEHILSNAAVLEELRVSFGEALNDGREPEHDQSSTEYKFCTGLFLLRKSSLRCRIKFSGKRTTASSDDFRKDVLNRTVNRLQ